jgi:hypothetical protein
MAYTVSIYDANANKHSWCVVTRPLPSPRSHKRLLARDRGYHIWADTPPPFEDIDPIPFDLYPLFAPEEDARFL